MIPKMNLLYKYEKYQDLSDKTVAKDFFRFAADYASADHMMVIYWDHGGGPIKGSEFALNDDGSDNRFMPFNDIVEAVESVKELRIKQGKQIDMIGFDCCLMGSVEIAYALRDCASYMVASEEMEPLDGWNYYWLQIFNEISGDMPKNQMLEAIGRRIVDLYPGDKIVDKTDHSTLDDVGKAIEKWEDRDPDFYNGTLALIDLSRNGKSDGHQY